MPLPEPNLDNLRFQRDLVDEARRRIQRYCPEWTDYNLSDPGITLIELFAWMTETILYRLNRVPEKNYIQFLNMMNVRLKPANSARTELTFRLSVPFPINPGQPASTVVPQGIEVATLPGEGEQEIIFTTDERLLIRSPEMTQVRRETGEDDFNRNYLSRLAGADIFYPFNRATPEVGDTFYLGFAEEQNISGHILQLNFTSEQTEGVGIKRDDPPWVWECSVGEGLWQVVVPSTYSGEENDTGGLNNPTGRLIVYLPLTMRPDLVHGVNAYWLRCRIAPRPDDPQNMYKKSPRIRNIVPQTLGATTPATHAVIIREEILGRSLGEAGQIFQLRNKPVLALREGETVEVEKPTGEGEDTVFIPWDRVDDFADADRHDRYFTLDTATAEVAFGPHIRQPDGTVREYGAIPPAGSLIRFSQYRHGGGIVGNVPAGKLQILRTAIPYIDRVTNLVAATGGRDQETLEEAKLRARREMRAQQRAVTTEDYEILTLGASRRIARVKCNAAGNGNGSLPPGMIELLIVPAVTDSLRLGNLGALYVDHILRQEVAAYLDQYRLLTTTLSVREPRYRGIKVYAEIVCSEYSRPETVRLRVAEALRTFLSPLPLGNPMGLTSNGEGLMLEDWHGWPFGKALYLSEIYSLIQQAPGVKHVVDVKLSEREVNPSKERMPGEIADDESLPELKPVEARRIVLAADTLLCSLEHEIQDVTL